mmetsp:Transcript_71572/g.190900  ORF Transcript_71572/g.190900 Transcript_71572/m.190900 type:complete len:830 (-) Transcript_71572:890-3379(-)
MQPHGRDINLLLDSQVHLVIGRGDGSVGHPILAYAHAVPPCLALALASSQAVGPVAPDQPESGLVLGRVRTSGGVGDVREAATCAAVKWLSHQPQPPAGSVRVGGERDSGHCDGEGLCAGTHSSVGHAVNHGTEQESSPGDSNTPGHDMPRIPVLLVPRIVAHHEILLGGGPTDAHIAPHRLLPRTGSWSRAAALLGTLHPRHLRRVPGVHAQVSPGALAGCGFHQTHPLAIGGGLALGGRCWQSPAVDLEIKRLPRHHHSGLRSQQAQPGVPGNPIPGLTVLPVPGGHRALKVARRRGVGLGGNAPLPGHAALGDVVDAQLLAVAGAGDPLLHLQQQPMNSPGPAAHGPQCGHRMHPAPDLLLHVVIHQEGAAESLREPVRRHLRYRGAGVAPGEPAEQGDFCGEILLQRTLVVLRCLGAHERPSVLPGLVEDLHAAHIVRGSGGDDVDVDGIFRGRGDAVGLVDRVGVAVEAPGPPPIVHPRSPQPGGLHLAVVQSLHAEGQPPSGPLLLRRLPRPVGSGNEVGRGRDGGGEIGGVVGSDDGVLHRDGAVIVCKELQLLNPPPKIKSAPMRKPKIRTLCGVRVLCTWGILVLLGDVEPPLWAGGAGQAPHTLHASVGGVRHVACLADWGPGCSRVKAGTGEGYHSHRTEQAALHISVPGQHGLRAGQLNCGHVVPAALHTESEIPLVPRPLQLRRGPHTGHPSLAPHGIGGGQSSTVGASELEDLQALDSRGKQVEACVSYGWSAPLPHHLHPDHIRHPLPVPLGQSKRSQLRPLALVAHQRDHQVLHGRGHLGQRQGCTPRGGTKHLPVPLPLLLGHVELPTLGRG